MKHHKIKMRWKLSSLTMDALCISAHSGATREGVASGQAPKFRSKLVESILAAPQQHVRFFLLRSLKYVSLRNSQPTRRMTICGSLGCFCHSLSYTGLTLLAWIFPILLSMSAALSSFRTGS